MFTSEGLDRVEIDLGLPVGVFREDDQPAVGTRRCGDPAVAVDCGGEDEAVVVVGVVTDDVDAPRGAGNVWSSPEASAKGLGEPGGCFVRDFAAIMQATE